MTGSGLYLWLISALIVLLVVAVGFIYRQMQRLSAARNKLEHANEQLQLSNNIKEEYVGRFMNLCSVYINRLIPTGGWSTRKSLPGRWKSC